MSDRIGFQKDVFHRVLRLHSLRSKSENFELLQLAIDDPVIFDLAYDQIMERVAVIAESESAICCSRNGNRDVIVHNSAGLLSWLSANRAEILIEVNSIVESLGGLEIASFLFEENTNGLASELV